MDGSDFVQRDCLTYKIFDIFDPFAKCLEYFPIFMITTHTYPRLLEGMVTLPAEKQKIVSEKKNLLQNNFQSFWLDLNVPSYYLFLLYF